METKLKQYREDFKNNPIPDESANDCITGNEDGDDGYNTTVRIPVVDLASIHVETQTGTEFGSELIQLLQSLSEPYIYAAVYFDASATDHNRGPAISYLAVFCDGPTAELIAELASVRWDDEDDSLKWQTFEAE